MREHPDHYDAELLLRLFDLRREEQWRQARDWFEREFRAQTVEEFDQQHPPGSETNTFLLMVLDYWEMAASIVCHGLIKQEFFFENTQDFWWVWEKIRALAPGARQQSQNPHLWKNLETLATEYEKWMGQRAPGALDALRRRMRTV